MISLFFLISCSEEPGKIQDSNNSKYLFSDGFETNNDLLDELFPNDGSRWTTRQQTNPSNATNEIAISTGLFSEGKNALRILAQKSDSLLSKIDIEKNGLSIQKEDRVRIKADFYINSTESLENLLLIDLECCSCWDPTVGDNFGSENQCPGVRLIMSGGNDFLSIERGKIGASSFQQLSYAFPRNQWVSLIWEMTISDNEDGLNRLIINDEEVINQEGMNLPNALVFKNIFLNQGIDFTLQEPNIYERVQIGATANPTADSVELYVDNFSIEINY